MGICLFSICRYGNQLVWYILKWESVCLVYILIWEPDCLEYIDMGTSLFSIC